MILSFSKKADEDFEDIQKWMFSNGVDEETIKNVLRQIFDSLEILETFPNAGSPLIAFNGMNTGYRYITKAGYLAFYRVISRDKVVVDRILSQKMNCLRFLLNDSSDL